MTFLLNVIGVRAIKMSKFKVASVALDEQCYERVKAIAEKDERTVSYVLRKIVKEHFNGMTT